MRSLTDTIVAPITGTQPAPVAVLRLSGPDAWEIASKVFSPWPGQPQPMKAIYGRVESGDAIALPFAEGKSYTGDQCVEISVHGSRASVQSLLDACLNSGARFAEPGEFTYRAFLNGRLDLSQAEGVRDAIEAKTDAQLRQAELHRSGELNQKVSAIRDRLASVLAAIEASVDFSEEVGELDRESAHRKLSDAFAEIDALSRTSERGRLLRQGIRIAIAGRPNAGKSSLLNAILGSERAIVTDVPGTTRDYVEEGIEHDGLLWVLVDTAGLRQTDDQVESIGVERAEQVMRLADFVWYLYDANTSWTEEDARIVDLCERPTLIVANKADLNPAPKIGMAISALRASGIEELFSHTKRALAFSDTEQELLVNSRHAPLLAKAAETLNSAKTALETGAPDDLVGVGIFASLQALGEITGEAATEDMLERMFRDFCIGK